MAASCSSLSLGGLPKRSDSLRASVPPCCQSPNQVLEACRLTPSWTATRAGRRPRRRAQRLARGAPGEPRSTWVTGGIDVRSECWRSGFEEVEKACSR